MRCDSICSCRLQLALQMGSYEYGMHGLEVRNTHQQLWCENGVKCSESQLHCAIRWPCQPWQADKGLGLLHWRVCRCPAWNLIEMTTYNDLAVIFLTNQHVRTRPSAGW
jgi:hypothetical protein